MSQYLFTSESVTEGHPDKICDQISDAILDAILKEDPTARVACETCVNTGMVLVMGEITTSCYVDIPKIARETILGIGYDRAKYGFDGETCAVLTSIDEQSPDIAQGVNRDAEGLGAGDQGMMFGYASDETEELMPLPIVLAHKLAKRLSQVRKEKIVDYLYPDGKTQVTVEYRDDKPFRVDTIVVSSQHADKDEITQEVIYQDIKKHVIDEVIDASLMDDNTKILVNPTGRFTVGGPQGDSGVTGRKIIVDTYGGMARHGGGAFSGKDPSKVDRSAAYATRYVAKNLVAAKLASKVEVQVAYAIGKRHPVSIFVDSFHTGVLSDDELANIVRKEFDLRPSAIIENLDLLKPIYKNVAAYGHMGRLDLDLSWEKTDRVHDLQVYLPNKNKAID
jgi:S-adenosylmethionine synthetase